MLSLLVSLNESLGNDSSQTGTVSYNLSNWLDKNKDPLNDSVVDQMKNASNK